MTAELHLTPTVAQQLLFMRPEEVMLNNALVVKLLLFFVLSLVVTDVNVNTIQFSAVPTITENTCC